jgi:hypothetical protein
MKNAGGLKKVSPTMQATGVDLIADPKTIEKDKNVFTLRDGREATHQWDSDSFWFVPSENPFGFGCCECGLYHKVKYQIDGDRIGLLFARDDKETKYLREYMRSWPWQWPNNLQIVIADKDQQEKKTKADYKEAIGRIMAFANELARSIKNDELYYKDTHIKILADTIIEINDDLYPEG